MINMDLNKPINFDLKLNKEFLQENLVQLSFGLFGITLSAVFAYLTYEQYERFGAYEENKSQIAQLQQAKLDLDTKITEQKNKFGLELRSLQTAPNSKTQLQSFITAQAEKYKIKVVKLLAAEPAEKGKPETIEIEFQGDYSRMRSFLGEVNSIIGASQVDKLKLTPANKSNEVIATLLIIYKDAPPSLIQPNATPAQSRWRDYQFERFEDWIVLRAQFVPKDQKSVASRSLPNGAENSSQGSSEETRNPFEAPAKTPTAGNGAVNQTDSGISNQTEKSLSAYYLSGIVFSAGKKICVVTLPAGETKLFTEGQTISNRIKVLKIEKSKVILEAGKRLEVKVGDEIPL